MPEENKNLDKTPQIEIIDSLNVKLSTGDSISTNKNEKIIQKVPSLSVFTKTLALLSSVILLIGPYVIFYLYTNCSGWCIFQVILIYFFIAPAVCLSFLGLIVSLYLWHSTNFLFTIRALTTLQILYLMPFLLQILFILLNRMFFMILFAVLPGIFYKYVSSVKKKVKNAQKYESWD